MKAVVAVLLFWGAVAFGQVPATCVQYQLSMAKALANRAGPNAPLALFAAQMLQESSCNSQAKSSAGALGLTQFMPDTANWIATIDNSLQPAEPLNAEWAIRAQIAYMYWLAHRTSGLTECDTMSFALSSYNGGEGWLHRDQRATQAAGANPAIWFGAVELHADTRRHPGMVAENRGYPQRIVFKLQPLFVAADWGRGIDCIPNEEIIYEREVDVWTYCRALIERVGAFFAVGT